MVRALLPEDLWSLIAAHLPTRYPSPKGGRSRIDDRAALTGILFVLKAVEDYEATAKKALDGGSEGLYRFDDAAFCMFARLVCYQDAQLESAPWKALSLVAISLEQYGRAV